MQMINWMNVLLMAPAPQGDAAGSPPAWVSMMPMVIIFVLLYFLLIRPQVKRQKEQDALIRSVKTGDQVIAAGGIHGVISNVKDKTLIMKIAEGVKIEIQREAVVSIVKSEEETKGNENS